MNSGKALLAQILDYIPKYEFDKLVIKYRGNYKAQEFSCWEQYVCMVFAQLTNRDSLRDIETCLRTVPTKLYHCGIRSKVSKSTLAYWNETRDWRIYSELAQTLIVTARNLYAKDNEFIKELDAAVYAFDSTSIHLCLSLFPWAKYKRAAGGIKAHTLFDLHSRIPVWIFISEGRLQDVNVLDELPIETGAYYVLDRGYIDWSRLFCIEQAKAFWITRARIPFSFKRQYSNKVDKATGIICDQIGVLIGYVAHKDYPLKIRRVKYLDKTTGKMYVFITNNMQLTACMIANLYKQRWQIELFFKWIKQHLRIKAFYGTSSNAVHTQIWIAVSVYVLIAIIKKQLGTSHSLYTLLQKLSVCIFEKIPIFQAFQEIEIQKQNTPPATQLKMF